MFGTVCVYKLETAIFGFDCCRMLAVGRLAWPGGVRDCADKDLERENRVGNRGSHLVSAQQRTASVRGTCRGP